MDPKDAGAAPIDFFTFVLSLASSGFVHLGDAPHPETGQPGTPDLVLAQQAIDILAMLKEKTHGNLSAEEEKFLDNLLTDLRLRFVAVKSGHAEPQK